MHAPIRYVALVLGVIISLHYILSFTHEEYGRVTSFTHIASKLGGGFSGSDSVPIPEEFYYDVTVNQPKSSNVSSHERANATMLMLARNSDLKGVIQSVRQIEDRFNRKYKYPWVFLNEEPFTEEFKQRVSVLTDSPIEFGQIPRDDWFQPSWIDEERASQSRQKMVDENVIYGGSVPYRNMCRFNSGFFFKHDLLLKYRYYWRVEPDVFFHCDIDFDPFAFMEKEKKVYGFTIAMYEFEKTIQSLWNVVIDFVRQNPHYVVKDNALGFITDNGGDTYNLCHFWSNFEIADLDFWRGEAYTAFFNHLDAAGGFYYERWGDAPVHSIAAALFASKEQIHFFDEIGYSHAPFTHCPRSEEKWRKGKCGCDPNKSFDYEGYSCMRQWDRT